jgi:hypothetical protein
MIRNTTALQRIEDLIQLGGNCWVKISGWKKKGNKFWADLLTGDSKISGID